MDTAVRFYHVYILECADGSYYTGQSSNLDIRLMQHQLGFNPAAYTFSRRPVKLVYAEVFYDRESAVIWERKLKGWSRAKKRAVIDGNWDYLPELAACKNETSHRNFGEGSG